MDNQVILMLRFILRLGFCTLIWYLLLRATPTRLWLRESRCLCTSWELLLSGIFLFYPATVKTTTHEAGVDLLE